MNVDSRPGGSHGDVESVTHQDVDGDLPHTLGVQCGLERNPRASQLHRVVQEGSWPILKDCIHHDAWIEA